MPTQVIEPIECHVDQIVFRIVRHAEKRNPRRDDLVAQVVRRDFYLGLLPESGFRHPLKEGPPF